MWMIVGLPDIEHPLCVGITVSGMDHDLAPNRLFTIFLRP
jgi:hypothetical protein